MNLGIWKSTGYEESLIAIFFFAVFIFQDAVDFYNLAVEYDNCNYTLQN